ncbi:MAG: glycosyltransferase family 39 protein [Pirellulaceae bacterium]|nr:glycosyltransferase family 39 protein [Pirellulaceae bacterium]
MTRRVADSVLNLLELWWNKSAFPGQRSENAPAADNHRMAWLAGVAVMTLAAVSIGHSLNHPLFEPDETRYAQIALEMYETGDWTVPKISGQAYMDKPPMLFWSIATSYHLLGVSQFAARAPVALAAWLTILTTYVLGRKLFGTGAAVAGTCCLLCTGLLAVASRFLLTDAILTFATTTASLAMIMALHRESSRSTGLWLILAGVAIGLGILTKGPIALLLTIPPVGIYYRLSNQVRQLHHWHYLAVLAPALSLPAPWFVLMLLKQPGFIQYFFWKHNFQRFTDTFQHEQPFWFYLPILLVAMAPTTFLIPAALRFLTSSQPLVCRMRCQPLGAVLLSASWVVFFFSLSDGKLPAYILPSVPLLSLAIAVCLHRAWVAQRSHQTPPANSTLISGQAAAVGPIVHWSRQGARIGTLLVLIGGLILIPLHGYLARQLTETAIIFGLLVTAALVWLKWFAPSNRRWLDWPWGYAMGASLLVGYFGFGQVLPQFSYWRSDLQLVRQMLTSNPTQTVVFYDRLPNAFQLELPAHTSVITATSLQELQAIAAHPLGAILLTDRQEVAQLRAEAADTLDFQQCPGHRDMFVIRAPEPAGTHSASARPIPAR